MNTHELKCWQPFFAAILSGDKTFEVRKDDRDFTTGDTLRLRETTEGGAEYTGNEAYCEVTYLMRNSQWLLPDMCVMAIRMVSKRTVTATEPADSRGKRAHTWDRDGERCTVCGAKDWMDNAECSSAFHLPPFHNPGNLTPDQIGIRDGWRLLVVDELIVPKDGEVWMSNRAWLPSWAIGTTRSENYSYRTRQPLPEPLCPRCGQPGDHVAGIKCDSDGKTVFYSCAMAPLAEEKK